VVSESANPPFPDYPFTRHFFDVGGAKMHFLDEGPREAEPILMLHGNPTWSFIYRHVVTALSADYRCIAPDHVGMGLSDTPAEDRYRYTLTRRVDDIDRLLDHLGITKNLTLLLHDWGGMIGMTWARRRRSAVRRIALLNTAAFPLPEGAKLPWQLTFSRTALGALAIRGFNAFSRYAVRRCVTRRPLRREIAAAYLAPYRSWHERLAVLRFVQDIPLSAADESYGEVEATAGALKSFGDRPAIIFWGMKDFVFDDRFLRRWLEYLPGAEVHRYDDSGHYLLEERGEEIIPLLREFLSSHPLASR
jgi:pimeloyl-ACP methyl ester carboxylesterase